MKQFKERNKLKELTLLGRFPEHSGWKSMDPSSWRPAEPRQCKDPKWQNNNSDTMTTNDG